MDIKLHGAEEERPTVYFSDFPESSGPRKPGNHCYNCVHWCECSGPQNHHMGSCFADSVRDPSDEWDVFTEQNDYCDAYEAMED